MARWYSIRTCNRKIQGSHSGFFRVPESQHRKKISLPDQESIDRLLSRLRAVRIVGWATLPSLEAKCPFFELFRFYHVIIRDIDLFHNGVPIKYSFVLMLISLPSLVAMGKIQKNILPKMRPVAAININTIEY